MRRPPPFFGIQPFAEGEAVDMAKCAACQTFVQFDIDHLSGVTLERCQCHSWQPLARRLGVPTPVVPMPQRSPRLDKTTRRHRVLMVLPQREDAALTILEASESSKVDNSTIRKDLKHLITRGIVRQKSIHRREITRDRTYSVHVFWRAA